MKSFIFLLKLYSASGSITYEHLFVNAVTFDEAQDILKWSAIINGREYEVIKCYIEIYDIDESEGLPY